MECRRHSIRSADPVTVSNGKRVARLPQSRGQGIDTPARVGRAVACRCAIITSHCGMLFRFLKSNRNKQDAEVHPGYLLTRSGIEYRDRGSGFPENLVLVWLAVLRISTRIRDSYECLPDKFSAQGRSIPCISNTLDISGRSQITVGCHSLCRFTLREPAKTPPVLPIPPARSDIS
jgi:hypothetical protein